MVMLPLLLVTLVCFGQLWTPFATGAGNREASYLVFIEISSPTPRQIYHVCNMSNREATYFLIYWYSYLMTRTLDILEIFLVRENLNLNVI